MALLYLLAFAISPPPHSPPPPLPPESTKQWWEVLLDPPILIPVIIGALVAIFLFIFIFKYCNRERSESLVNVIDSASRIITKVKGKSKTPEEKDDTIYIGRDNDKKIKQAPKLSFKK